MVIARPQATPRSNTDTHKPHTPLSHPTRSNFASCVIGRKLYVMGGFNDPSTCAETECFTNACYINQDRVCDHCHGTDVRDRLYLNHNLAAAMDHSSGGASPTGANDGAAAADQNSQVRGQGDFARSFETSISTAHAQAEWNVEGLPLCNCQLEYGAKALYNKEADLQNGRWENLSRMVVERSAHSCCVVANFPTVFLRRLQEIE